MSGYYVCRFSLVPLLVMMASNIVAEQAKQEKTAGMIGIRPLPRNAAEAEQPWLSGIGNYQDHCGEYEFVAKHTDILKDHKGCFATDKVFFEHYLPFDQDWIDTNPENNPLIQTIRNREANGQVVEHILICREAELIGRGKWGPFPEDSRILFQRDVDEFRQLFRDAHAQNLIQHDNYKLIQLITHASAFLDIPEAVEIIQSMDGIAYESHQFNRHWPFETGWTRPEELVRGAEWTLAQGKEYIFYYGPFIYKEFDEYYEFAERDWLYRYWEKGLPKHHPNMHYYLNAFPHAHGANRPVGPESDPHSYLGMLRWLIEEIKGDTISEEE